MSLPRTVIAAAIGSVALTCALAAPAGAAVAQVAPKVVKVNDTGKGVQHLTLHRGQILAFSLTECGDCGYAWRRLVLPQRSVLALGPQAVVSEAPAGAVGGESLHTFRFIAKKAGSARTTLGYYSPAQQQTRVVELVVTITP